MLRLEVETRFVLVFGDAAERKKREPHHDSKQAGAGLNSAYSGAYGAVPPVSLFNFLFLLIIIIFARQNMSSRSDLSIFVPILSPKE